MLCEEDQQIVQWPNTSGHPTDLSLSLFVIMLIEAVRKEEALLSREIDWQQISAP